MAPFVLLRVLLQQTPYSAFTPEALTTRDQRS
jgi:hypothetical protein